jgi:HD-like signal output (HDOD) protein
MIPCLSAKILSKIGQYIGGFMLAIFKNLFGKEEAQPATQGTAVQHSPTKALPEWYENFKGTLEFTPCKARSLRPEHDQWLELMSDADILARPLVPPGSSSLNLFAKITDESTSSKDAAIMAADDPILTARILKSVNSAYYGLPNSVGDVHTAVNLMGLDQLKILIMSQAVESQTRPDSGLEKIAVHSAIVGQIAGFIAAKVNLSRSTLTTLGVLHDMGRLLLPYVEHPNGHFASAPLEVQRGLLGGAFARIWNLPHSLANIIENLPFASYGDSSEVYSDHAKEIHVLALAQFFANAFGFDDGSAVEFPQKSAEALGLTDAPNYWFTAKQVEELQKTALLF